MSWGEKSNPFASMCRRSALAAGTGAFQFLQLGQVSDYPKGFRGVECGQLLPGTA